MKKSKILFLSVLSMLIIVSSCKKDDVDPINEAEILVSFIEANSDIKTLPAYVAVDASQATKAASGPTLPDMLLTGDAYVIDIRSASAFEGGHIVGAINVDIAAQESVIEHVVANETEIGDKTIVMVCYSGQSAAFESALVKLAGYTNVKSLLFGMCGWLDGIHGSWNSGVRNEYNDFVELTANVMGSEFPLPDISTGYEVGSDILLSRLMAVEAAGFGAIAVSGDVAWANKDTYYIMNYWNADHYALGHIPGAIQYDPTSDASPFTAAEYLKTIPTDGTTSVVYCYTGQTSAWVATYLNVLGYDAKTMTFGVNGMWEEDMPGTRWLAYKASHNLANPLHNDEQ